MAVTPARQGLRESVDGLKAEGAKAPYAIHPVAGRKPRQMNLRPADSATQPRRANVK